eukprot:4035623-Amphidinium_carterae.1
MPALDAPWTVEQKLSCDVFFFSSHIIRAVGVGCFVEVPRSIDACEEALIDAARHVAIASVKSAESDLPEPFRDPHDCLRVVLAGVLGLQI